MLEFAWPLAALALVLPALALGLLPRAAPLATPLRVPFLHEARAWSARDTHVSTRSSATDRSGRRSLNWLNGSG